MVRLGQQAEGHLLLGLKSSHSRVKSVCAMSLIRIGQPIVTDLCAFYISTPNRSKLRWIVEFILNELGGQQLPSLEGEMAGGNVIPFVKTTV